jgi:hypothetical protein
MEDLIKEFVPYPEALELKELRFNKPCFKEFHFKRLVNNSTGSETTNYELIELYGEEDVVAAPTYSQAFRWFREKYGLFTSIIVDQTTKPKFYYNISEYYEVETIWEWKDGWGNSSLYRIYEEAELACLRKLIEIVKHKKTS